MVLRIDDSGQRFLKKDESATNPRDLSLRLNWVDPSSSPQKAGS
jgi:hypothetical protein